MTPSSSSTRSSLCLGLCLGAREVGMAVVSREHLVFVKVVHLGEASALRLQRFMHIVRELLDRYCPRRIAVVTLQRPGLSDHAVTEQWTALRDTARQLVTTHYTADQIRASHLSTGRQSTRALADLLGDRFPELTPHAPSTRAARHDQGVVPGHAQRHVVSSHERYWSRAFLALAGALHDLEVDLCERLQLQLPLPIT